MSRKKKKNNYKKVIIVLLFIIILIISFAIIKPKFKKSSNSKNENVMITLDDLEKAKKFSDDKNIDLNIKYEYSDTVSKDKIISQSIEKGRKLDGIKSIDIVVSLGKLDKEKLASDNINELGNVPIMMYHGIINKSSSETNYTGGNVDKDGYNRTVEAFREDLEFYYKNNYRMIRLKDYIDGKIDTEYGKSPLIITFDDGNDNNIKVNGLDSDGNIIIDENSAVGVLESFKKKYPDYKVTATFFVNGGLFNQDEYNEKIVKWLVDNGYDVGNHTETHLDIKKSSSDRVQKEIAVVYDKLDKIIPGKYVKIIALPFGSPYNKDNENFKYVLNGTYNNISYETEGCLRVGWEAEVSPFNKSFDKTFMKRIRAYDNNGKDFDIKMNFDLLKNKRYISDGNVNTIITSSSNESIVNSRDLEVIYY